MNIRQFVVLLLFVMLPKFGWAEDDIVRLATGQEGGSYAVIMTQIGELFKREGKKVEYIRSSGSLSNLYLVETGVVDFALAQEDTYEVFAKAYKNTNDVKTRSVTPISLELLHLVARKDKAINSIGDLKGKAVAIGTFGSGTFYTSVRILTANNINITDIQPHFGSLRESLYSLLGGKIDAMFFVGTAPVQEFSSLGEGVRDYIQLVSITKPPANKNSRQYFELRKMGGKNSYRFLKGGEQTIGVRAILITSSEQRKDTVKTVLRLLRENKDYLVGQGGVWSDFDEIQKKQKNAFNPFSMDK